MTGRRPAGRAGGKHIAGLDGMRALSVIAVLFYHLDMLGGGYVGVDVFFVLSGFLITSLLVAEHTTRDRISLRAFYVRRAFRLLPAFYAYALAGIAFVFVVGADGGFGEYFRGLLSSAFGVNNWHRVADLDGGGVWFGQTWSLSVEDQFYLLWPGLFIGLMALSRRRPRLDILPVLIAAVVAIAGWRIVLVLLGADGPRIYLGLDTRADSLLVGAALAVWFARIGARAGADAPASDAAGGDVSGAAARAAGRSGTWWRRIGLLGPLAGAGLVVFAFVGPEPGPPEPTWMAWGGYTLISLATGVVIMGVVSNVGARPWLRFLGSVPMVHLGRVSYAFYLWHFPVCDIAKQHVDERFGALPTVAFAFVGTYLLAYLSMVLVERPAARRRPSWADVGVRFTDSTRKTVEILPQRAPADSETDPTVGRRSIVDH